MPEGLLFLHLVKEVYDLILYPGQFKPPVIFT